MSTETPESSQLHTIAKTLAATNISTPENFPEDQKSQLISLTHSHSFTSAGTVGVAVIDSNVGVVRDAAETLKRESGKDTVIVITPDGSEAVSNTIARYLLESHNSDLSIASPASSTETFLSEVGEGQKLPWASINILLIAAILIAVVATLWATMRTRLTGSK